MFKTKIIKEYQKKYIKGSSDYNQIKSILKKYNISLDQFTKSILENYNINIDYDDVLVKFVKTWINFLNKKYHFNYKEEDIKTFFQFDIWQKEHKDKDIFFIFNQQNFYDNVEIYKEAKEFIELIKKYQFQKYYILTASKFSLAKAKANHIKRNFDINSDRIIMASSKSDAGNHTFGTHIDDGIHNIDDIITQNPYNYIFIVDYYHNKNYINNKRVIRVNNILEVFQKIPLTAALNINRIMDPKKDYLKKELIFGEKKD